MTSTLLVFWVVYVVIRRGFWLVSHLLKGPSGTPHDPFDFLMDMAKGHLDITRATLEALTVIANDGGLAPEGQRKLKELLYGTSSTRLIEQGEPPEPLN